jgi:dihydropyrimidine dehydrogenase (NAD+) subunit PreA
MAVSASNREGTMASSSSNLQVEFLGLRLRNPFLLASASPTRNSEMIARAFDAGWSGAVIKTIYASRLEREPKPLLHNVKIGARSIGMTNLSIAPPLGLEDWQREIPPLKGAYPDRVVIGSIASYIFERGEWQRLARGIAESGVDALEFDLSCTHNPDIQVDGRLPGEDVTTAQNVVSWVREAIEIPLIVKLPGLAPNLEEMVRACKDAGADGVSGINTLPCLAGVDLDTFCPLPSLKTGSTYSGYSGPAIKPIALRAVAQMATASRMPVSGIGGISSWQDAAEFILLGASTVQVCTAVMWHGFQIIDKFASGLSEYVRSKGFSSVQELVGLAAEKLSNIYDLESDDGLVARITQDRCTNCGLCVIACSDGAFQAIYAADDYPVIETSECDGCALCAQICPVGAIGMVSVGAV